MQYQYILFDLDGTITESGPGIMNSVSYAAEKMGRKSIDNEILKKFMGPPLMESMQKYLGMSESEAAKAVAYYREYYAPKGIFETSVYDGLTDTLKKLKEHGKILAMATSKPEKFAKQIAEKFAFAEYFTGIYGASMNETRTKKADVIHYALDSLHIKKEEYHKVLMVGDRHHDIIGAKENGLKSMGVLYGYGDRTELEAAGADYIAETATEIADIILS